MKKIFWNDFEHFSDVSALEIGEPGALFSKVLETFWVRQNLRIKARILANKPEHFVLLTNRFIISSGKLLKTWSGM